MNGLGARIRRRAKQASVRLFMGMDQLGAHVLPKHYYSPVADYKWLNRNKELWCRAADMAAVEWCLEDQLSWLRQRCRDYIHEVQGLRVYADAVRNGLGPGYGPIESQVLHCACRDLKPRRIIEVGCGVSTACMLHALRLNQSETTHPFEYVCVEPFPRPALSCLAGVHLARVRVQELPVEFFRTLESGDLLFIDSTHTVKTGSDTVYLLLEILPRLNPGVIVHLHDIYLPYLYRRDVLHNYFDWQETSLLLALLKGNRNLQTLCCLSALHYRAQSAFRQILPDYTPQADTSGGLAPPGAPGHFPSSFWLRIAPRAGSAN